MQIFRSIQHVSPLPGPSVLAIGNFDGVHRGHQAILSQVRQRAAQLKAMSVAVTFDPHPVSVLRPAQAPELITPLPQKLGLLAATGIDATTIIPFTPEFSQLSALEFARDVLLAYFRAEEVHEGDNFRFGHNASAGPLELAQLGHELGFRVISQPALYVRGIQVSSSHVRRLLSSGNLSAARALLGRPFSICSTPAKGHGIGARLTVPTINLAPYSELLPAHGVYVTRLKIVDSIFNAVTNIGYRPTFGENELTVESHILDFREIELTSHTPIELCFLSRVRPEYRFESPAALKEQILRDVAHARRYFRLLGSR